MKIFGIFSVTILLLSGCVSEPIITSDHVEIYESMFPYGKILDYKGSALASYIQWNADYAVTARHVGTLDESAYVCDANCDLQFIKHKSMASCAAWRDGVTDEPVIHMGVNVHGQTVVSTGKNIALPVTFDFAKNLPYRTSSSFVIPGMSGGPVYGEDGKIIGMTIASFMSTGHRESVYVPYSVILEQWRRFNTKITGK